MTLPVRWEDRPQAWVCGEARVAPGVDVVLYEHIFDLPLVPFRS